MEARIVIRAADPQAVLAQRVMGAFRVASIESIFVDYRVLIGCTCHAAVFTGLRFFFSSRFSVFRRCRRRSRSLSQRYQRRRRFAILNGIVHLFVIQLFHRWVRCLGRYGADACRQYQGCQYSGGASACAAARALGAAVSQFRYDDVLVLDLTPNHLINFIHVYIPPSSNRISDRG